MLGVTELHMAFVMLDRNCDGHVYVDDMMMALGHTIEKHNVRHFVATAGNGGKLHIFVLTLWLRTEKLPV